MLFSLSQGGRISPAKARNDPPQTPSGRAARNAALFFRRSHHATKGLKPEWIADPDVEFRTVRINKYRAQIQIAHRFAESMFPKSGDPRHPALGRLLSGVPKTVIVITFSMQPQRSSNSQSSW